MKLIFISGPSGSGKTTLSNQIIKKIKNGIVLSTDNYYKTGLISKLLSKILMVILKAYSCLGTCKNIKYVSLYKCK